jgi:hypothetical protein
MKGYESKILPEPVAIFVKSIVNEKNYHFPFGLMRRKFHLPASPRSKTAHTLGGNIALLLSNNHSSPLHNSNLLRDRQNFSLHSLLFPMGAVGIVTVLLSNKSVLK